MGAGIQKLGGPDRWRIIDLPGEQPNDHLSGKHYCLLFFVSVWTLEGRFEQKRCPSRSHGSPRALLPELQRIRDTVRCAAIGGGVLLHGQEQLMQTLTVCMLKMHLLSLFQKLGGPDLPGPPCSPPLVVDKKLMHETVQNIKFLVWAMVNIPSISSYLTALPGVSFQFNWRHFPEKWSPIYNPHHILPSSLQVTGQKPMNEIYSWAFSLNEISQPFLSNYV